ncbi:MAG: hypoxanthine phosphoribosyltransferase [Bacillota bacterium]|nr:hypoxanthine phosphoribosyltransferase [Bacillota bacterium]MDK2856854.1 hypoxanthine phosphoribosyltransferase [Bacillota bacterium]MDK2926057.1 hypoxanthine phosphoribosyltransferase [Bacillota bacterium]
MSSIKQILVDEATLKARIKELGAAITRDYSGKSLFLVGILKGAVIFLGELAQRIDLPATFDFMAVSSYGSATESSGVVRILKDLDESLEGRHVLIVEDIIDTGLTLDYLYRHLAARQPASLAICTLLDKPSRRRVQVPVKYVGFQIPDYFVVGFGLDFNEMYRNLPYIAVLEP